VRHGKYEGFKFGKDSVSSEGTINVLNKVFNLPDSHPSNFNSRVEDTVEEDKNIYDAAI
jgi:hypothetical protein